MKDDEPQVVPGLSDDTPVERPVTGRPRGRRAPAQREPVPEFSPPPLQPHVSEPPIAAAPRAYRRFRVVEEFHFSRGASMAVFEVGDVLSEQHYDVAGLVKQGCKLEELPARL